MKMRKFLLPAMCMIAAGAMVGCSQESATDTIDASKQGQKVTIAAGQQPQTRVVLAGDNESGYAYNWESDDQLNIYGYKSATENWTKQFDVQSITNNGKTAMFEAFLGINDLYTNATYCGYMNTHDAVPDAENKTLGLTIPDQQDGTLIGEMVGWADAASIGDLNLNLKPATTVVKAVSETPITKMTIEDISGTVEVAAGAATLAYYKKFTSSLTSHSGKGGTTYKGKITTITGTPATPKYYITTGSCGSGSAHIDIFLKNTSGTEILAICAWKNGFYNSSLAADKQDFLGTYRYKQNQPTGSGTNKYYDDIKSGLGYYRFTESTEITISAQNNGLWKIVINNLRSSNSNTTNELTFTDIKSGTNAPAATEKEVTLYTYVGFTLNGYPAPQPLESDGKIYFDAECETELSAENAEWVVTPGVVGELEVEAKDIAGRVSFDGTEVSYVSGMKQKVEVTPAEPATILTAITGPVVDDNDRTVYTEPTPVSEYAGLPAEGEYGDMTQGEVTSSSSSVEVALNVDTDWVAFTPATGDEIYIAQPTAQQPMKFYTDEACTTEFTNWDSVKEGTYQMTEKWSKEYRTDTTEDKIRIDQGIANHTIEGEEQSVNCLRIIVDFDGFYQPWVKYSTTLLKIGNIYIVNPVAEESIPM